MTPELREALARRLHRRSVVRGEIRLPAVPGMLDEYVAMCDTTFAAVGRRFTADQLDHIRGVLKDQVALAFSESARSSVVIIYEAQVGGRLNYHVRPEWASVEAVYDDWVATREPPYFGTEPDARVWALALDVADPRGCRVLDIGAGTGRNTLALARRGHPVDAVEITSKFAESIAAESRSLDVRVFQRDVFEGTGDLPADYGLIVLSEVVSDFRSSDQLRGIFELAAVHLRRGGNLVFNAFLPRGGYVPDEAARQLGQQVYTSIFTRDEVAAACDALPLELVADDSVYEFEKVHLPAGCWPPTGWYEEWVSGLDVFDVDRAESPIEMRWLVFRRTA